MPRQQRDLDPDGGPITEFARGLRDLRASNGDPKFTTMARRTGRSKTALAEAAGGRRLPRWETVEDFVRACEGDPAVWHERWLAVRGAVGGRSSAGVPGGGRQTDPTDPTGSTEPAGSTGAAPEAPEAVPGPSSPPDRADQAVQELRTPAATTATSPTAGAAAGTAAGRRPRWRRIGVAAAALAVALAVGAVGGFVAGRQSAGPQGWEVLQLRAIEVQNKVALGPDRLEEDTTTAYLSEIPVSACARPSRQCKVPDTDVVSGAALVAHCTVRGQRMHNYNIEEQAALSTPNPHMVSSDLWYRAAFPDGRVGVISEVYLAEYSRGGLGLPDCGSNAAVTDARGG